MTINTSNNPSIQEKTLAVSVGICAYNEAKDIRNMLLSLLGQKTKRICIKEVIVVSDGSIDGTDEIIKGFASDCNIRHISQKQRAGKYSAVNRFISMASAKSSVLVLSSADIILHEEAIENLCSPFLSDHTIGITGAHPIPKNQTDSFLGYVTNLQWYLHHKLSLSQPKFGELIAFRSNIHQLPPTFVDEEQIASIIKSKGYLLAYIPEAIIYNKGPENIRDFLMQRRRIYTGHLMLKKKDGYEVTTLSGVRILKCLLTKLPHEYKKNTHWLLGAIFLEILGRMRGRLDILFKKNFFNYEWEIAKSTKNLDRYNEEPIRR